MGEDENGAVPLLISPLFSAIPAVAYKPSSACLWATGRRRVASPFREERVPRFL